MRSYFFTIVLFFYLLYNTNDIYLEGDYMIRYSRSDIVEVDRLTQGTSAAFIGLNTKTGKKGIYKENGCMLGITNEDIREKLASDILKYMNISCADIDLVYDESLQQNACFSNYIIQDNEQLITPNVHNMEENDSDKIEGYCKAYVNSVKQLTDDETVIQACRKNFLKYTYMCCILDSYDLKSDNLPIVYNTSTKQYKPSPWFDFGTAFAPNSDKRSSFFADMHTDEVMETLFKNHYEDIKDIANKVHTFLTPENLNILFSKDYLLDSLESTQIQDIRTQIESQIQKSKHLEHKITNSTPNKFKTFISGLKGKLKFLLTKQKTLPQTIISSSVPNKDNTEDNNNFSYELSQLTNAEPTNVASKSKDFSEPEIL